MMDGALALLFWACILALVLMIVWGAIQTAQCGWDGPITDIFGCQRV